MNNILQIACRIVIVQIHTNWLGYVYHGMCVRCGVCFRALYVRALYVCALYERALWCVFTCVVRICVVRACVVVCVYVRALYVSALYVCALCERVRVFVERTCVFRASHVACVRTWGMCTHHDSQGVSATVIQVGP